MGSTVTGSTASTTEYPDYGSLFSDYQDAVASEAQDTQAEAQQRVVEVKPSGNIAISGETAFAGNELAKNNPRLDIEADIFLRNIDELNKQFIFGPFARVDATVAADYKRVLTNIRTETDPVFTDMTDIIEEKEELLVGERVDLALDLGVRFQHQLLPTDASSKLRLDYWLPLSFWSETRAADEVNYWLGLRPGVSLRFDTALWNMPLSITIEDSLGLGFSESTTRLENELRLELDWSFLSWLELRLRNVFRTTALIDVEAEYRERFSIGLRLTPMDKFFVDLKPFIYTYEATHPVEGDPYNGLMRMAGELTASFDISKDLSFLAGFNLTYAGVDRDQVNTPEAKPLTVFAGIELKL